MVDTQDSFDTGLRPYEVLPDRPLPIDTPWGSFAIFRCGDRFFATQSFCPHLLGPLFQGTLSGDTVTCPWHQWRFSLETGRRLDFSGMEMPNEPGLLRRRVATGPRGTLVLAIPQPDGCSPP
jgi:nitrite reductase/ring-hydroxylating ferredoxin subunit